MSSLKGMLNFFKSKDSKLIDHKDAVSMTYLGIRKESYEVIHYTFLDTIKKRMS